MAGVEYDVAAILQVVGDGPAAEKLGKVAKASDKASDAFKALRSDAIGALAGAGAWAEQAADRVVSFGVRGAMAIGAAGLAGAVAFLKVGLLDINQNLEDTRIGFGTLFNTFGAAQNIGIGLEMGAKLMGEIREDARKLPGEFQDFVGMAQTMTAPMLNMGKGMEDIRNLTQQTVVAAAALGLRYDQAGREMAMLLEGHAGAHNVLGTRLGIDTHTAVNGKAFNKATAEERLDFIQKKLLPTQDSLVEFTHSWGGMWSTIVDTAKKFAGDATAPLFERMKNTMERLLFWTNSHEAQINHLAEVVGGKLAYAWDRIVDFAETLPDRIQVWRDRAVAFGEDLVAAWHKVEPIVDRIAALAEKALHHPTEAMQALAAMKFGGMALQQLPGLVRVGGNIADMFGGGGAAAGEAAGAGEAAAGALGGAGAVAAIGVAVAALAVLTAVIDDVGGSAEKLWFTLSETWDAIVSAVEPMIEKGGLLRDILGLIGAVMIEVFVDAMQSTIDTFRAIGAILRWLNDLWRDLKFGLEGLFGSTQTMADEAQTAKESAQGLATAIEWVGVAALAAINPLLGAYAALKKLNPGNMFGPDEADLIHFNANDSPLTDKTTHVQEDAFSSHPAAPHLMSDKDRGLAKESKTVDARGSHITLQLNLKDNDPDRIIRRTFVRLGDVLARPLSSSVGAPQ